MNRLTPDSFGASDVGEANWIAGAIKRPGQLHRDLGVPEGRKIPHAEVVAATKSKDSQVRRRAHLALTLGGFSRRRKSKAPKARESNDCHQPAGQSTGGQFCSRAGGSTMRGPEVRPGQPPSGSKAQVQARVRQAMRRPDQGSSTAGTLAGWAEQHGVRLQPQKGGAMSTPYQTDAFYKDLWSLSDYRVSSVSGGSVWLAPRRVSAQFKEPKGIDPSRSVGGYQVLMALWDKGEAEVTLYKPEDRTAAELHHGQLRMMGGPRSIGSRLLPKGKEWTFGKVKAMADKQLQGRAPRGITYRIHRERAR